MGRFLGILLIVLLWAPAGVRAGCAMATSLSEVYWLEVGLAERPDNPLADNILYFITEKMAGLKSADLEQIAELHPSNDAIDVFTSFTQQTNQLLEAFQNDGVVAIKQHFDRNRVRKSLALTRQYLITLGCLSHLTAVVGPTTDASAFTTDEKARQDAAATDTSVGVVRRYLSTPTAVITTLLGVIGAVLVGIKIVQIMAQRRRRARRFACNYETQMQSGSTTAPCVLLDVSGRGTKLRHHGNEAVKNGAVIDLCIIDKWRRGTVVWCNAHYAGVQFRQPLRGKTVRRVRDRHHETKGLHDPQGLRA